MGIAWLIGGIPSKGKVGGASEPIVKYDKELVMGRVDNFNSSDSNNIRGFFH